MWFKKKSQISGFDANTAVDGTDWRTNGNGSNWYASQTLPSAADANNYFYLPALGFYYSGQLNYVGTEGYYWSSSAAPLGGNGNAYSLSISNSRVRVSSGSRNYGSRAGGFE